MEAEIVALAGTLISLASGVISALWERRQETKSVKSWDGEGVHVENRITGNVRGHITQATPPRRLVIPGEAPKPTKTDEPDVAEVKTVEVETVVRISPEDKEDVVRGVAAILKHGERRAFFIGFAQSAFFFALGVGVTLLVK